LIGRDLAEHPANLCTTAEQVGGLAADDVEVLVLGDVGIAVLGELVEFALDHLEGVRQRHRHRLDVQVITEQHGDVVAPAGVHGEAAAAQFGLVDDVVVHEGGGVNELDHGRVEHRAVALVAAQPRRHQQDGRAHALAAAGLDVLPDLRDQIDL
jgi:hypothetical protein